MTATQYLPIASISYIENYVQFSSTTSALATALTTAFGTQAGSIQVLADTTSGKTSNALVVVNDTVVFSVPANNWVGYNKGQWTNNSPAQMTANYLQYFTS